MQSATVRVRHREESGGRERGGGRGVRGRNDVNANLVFTWRRQFREQAGGAGGLVPVVVEPAGARPPLADAVTSDAPSAGRMEIALADGSRVIVDREVDGSALARVLSVLARR